MKIRLSLKTSTYYDGSVVISVSNLYAWMKDLNGDDITTVLDHSFVHLTNATCSRRPRGFKMESTE